MEERGLMMLLHSGFITALLYLGMVFVLEQKPKVAENRSLLLGSLVLIYMIVFGHGLPNKINKDLF